ncbi:MAG: molybdopterin-guanine dinucleotide biosynthesis protein B [Alphaproteobacteria bacterium]|nr:molybdopterin-guanine dinucleotide biosynthesis protein B [Alphaproteobacteria bacterium]
MRILGIAGFSGSGKTTLLTVLLPLLTARGLEVATLKHAHHGFDPLPLNHASQAWRQAGARDIILAAPARHMLVHELRAEPEPDFETLLPLLAPVDLLLIEGYKFGAHDKIEIYRGTGDAPLLAANDPHVIALVTDGARPPGLPSTRAIPLFKIDDVAAIANFVVGLCGAKPKPRAAAPAPC